MADKILYIVRGVPGSGKSTMAHKLSPIVVESDDFMMDNGEYKYDPKKVHYCHKKCFETVENHLKNGEPTVAVANTFIKKSLYEPYIELANKYGYKVIIRKADGNYQNIHNVPNNVVSSMKKRFQECIMEGFDIEDIQSSTKLQPDKNIKDRYNIISMGTNVGYVMINSSAKQGGTLTVGYIEIKPQLQKMGLAKIALTILKKEFNPSVITANITNNASLKAFCSVFGRPSMCYNANGEDVEDPSEGISDVPTETSSIDGEYNTCIWKIKANINESVEPKLNDNFWKWFGNSKVVDENGKPLVVYHGSPNKFEIFDILKTTDNLTYGKGFYFTNDKSAGDEYAGSNGKNYACYIRLINPYIINSPNMTHEERLKRTRIFRNKTDSRTELIKQGYDGILYEEYDELGQYIEVVAFYPNQIKSVDNNGNWSLNSDNINESKEIKINDNFKKWFGNSKVVDESGKPLVVYHGWNKEFEKFILQDKDVKGVKCAFFSSDINTAASYSEFGNVKDFYLRIENPLIYDANFSQYYIGKDNNHIMVALNKAKKGNYDGVIIKNIRDDSYQEYEEGYEIPYSTTYIVFNPNQIKAVNNNGNWSLEVDNINESKEIKFNDNFKKWFGNSKCVDKNGNPKVFIHRSNAKFNTFDKSKIGQRDHGWYGKGFYFGSAKQKDYAIYGKKVYKCFLRIENPFYYNEFFGSYSPNEMQMITAYDKLGILTPQESNFLQKYMDVYNHFNSNVKLKKVPQKVKDYNGKVYDSFYWVVQYNSKTTKTDAYMNPRDNTEDYAKGMFWREHYEKYFEKIEQINHNCYKTRMDKMSNAIRNMGYDGIVNADEYVVFEPNQIKSVKNNGNWSLNSDNINEEKEVIEERLFPELSDRKYNDLLWFTSPNMTANAYTKFFGKEMIADRIPAKYLISIGKSDEVLLNDLVEKHKRLRDANKIRPIADYNDFNEFIKDLNSSNYLSRNDKSNMARSGAKIIKSFGDWDLYAITSWNAAKKYGTGTTWCVTTSDSDNYFRKHVGKGDTDTFGGKFYRKLFFVINPEKDRKFAIGVEKSLSHNWYLASVDFYNETDYIFYDYSSSITNISFKDNLDKSFYENMSELDGSDAESYEEDESFFVDIMKYIRDEFRLNKEEVLEDMEQLRKDFKQKLGINESANNSTNQSIDEEIDEVLKLSGVN